MKQQILISGRTNLKGTNSSFSFIDQKEDGTLDDRRRDGRTNSTLKNKEQGKHLTLNEHDNDDDD